jgi:hypothetical protein
MKVRDDDAVDTVALALLEYIKSSRRETQLPPFKAQFLTGYKFSDHTKAETPTNQTAPSSANNPVADSLAPSNISAE